MPKELSHLKKTNKKSIKEYLNLSKSGIKMKKPNHHSSWITMIQPITEPNSKEPIFPSKTLEGYLLKSQKAIIEPAKAMLGLILSISPDINDLKINVEITIIESPDCNPL